MREWCRNYVVTFRVVSCEMWRIVRWLGWKGCLLAMLAIVTVEEAIVLIVRYS